MRNEDSLPILLKLLHQDIRLEVVLADLLIENISLDEFLILNTSLFHRNYHHDIEKVEENDYGKLKRTRLCFTVNRNGLYDNLPQDIFHQPADHTNFSGKEKALKELKAQEKMEESARQFFIPFEQEFYRQRIKLEVEERKYLFETNSNISGELFTELWDFPEFMDKLQKSKLGVLMPVINRIAGNQHLISFIIGNITGNSVELVESCPVSITVENKSALGETVLGFNCVLGGQIRGLQRSVTVKIGLDSTDAFDNYLPEGKKNQLYQFLCNLLIPLETDLIFDLYFDQNPDFQLFDENMSVGRLGYSTII
jgi:type VI secretion system protein ImpH